MYNATVFELLVNSRADTTFNLFYDGISILGLAIVLFSVFTLCYGPRLIFSGHPVLANWLCCFYVYGIETDAYWNISLCLGLKGQFRINDIF